MQQWFLKRKEVKQHKNDKEFKLQELEIDIKAKEMEQKETLNQLYQRYQQETVKTLCSNTRSEMQSVTGSAIFVSDPVHYQSSSCKLCKCSCIKVQILSWNERINVCGWRVLF